MIIILIGSCSILIFTCGLYNFLSDFTFMFRSYLWFLLCSFCSVIFHSCAHARPVLDLVMLCMTRQFSGLYLLGVFVSFRRSSLSVLHFNSRSHNFNIVVIRFNSRIFISQLQTELFQYWITTKSCCPI